ncbi:MAG: DUF4595 domain-containing protein [Bacteroidaceae bacterium]|nr:DUF4595 domain-containing protein [Bacteroidaceae bacterium]
MKTFRMIGMALMAVLMCVNFTACSEDDPTDEEGSSTTQPNNEKKLVGMSSHSERINDVYDFKYSKDGRISEIQTDYVRSYEQGIVIYKYNWHSKDSMTVTRDGELARSFYLSNGKIIRQIDYDTESAPEDFYYFEYDNEGHIKEYEFIDDEHFNNTKTYTWGNDKLLRCGINHINNYFSYSSTIYIRYSSTTFKGIFPLFCENVGLGQDDLFMVHPELVGARTIYLPTEIGGENEDEKYTFSYEFDTDGYVTSCTVIEYDHRSGSWLPAETYVYNFVWE